MKSLVDALRDKNSEVTIISFGSAAHTITPLTNVSVEDERHRLKDGIDSLDVLSGDDGATNWDAAFTALGQQRLNLVVIVTDGEPNAYGTPAQGTDNATDTRPLTAATTATDHLKAGGTRIVAVGIGLLDETATANLAKITGPEAGSDYYTSQVTDLLHQLYDIAAKACGVPISALPGPEPPSFPLAKVLLWATAGLLMVAAAAYLLHRRRRGPVSAASHSTPTSRPADPTIQHDDILREITGDRRAPGTRPSQKRSMSLDFLRDDRPARDE